MKTSSIQATSKEIVLVNQERFDKLDAELAAKWNDILSNSQLVKQIMEGRADKKLFSLYMFESYHYVYHKSRHQALVATRNIAMPPEYIQFCFERAEEEVGHELLALHDITTLGLEKGTYTIPSPMPATEVLTAYLYWISANGNHFQRLGYSFWAEDSYRFINPIVAKLQETLQLADSQLTFFISHSGIDAEHATEFKSVMDKYLKTDEDWKDVERVMITSLDLQGRILDSVYEEYGKLIRGEKTDYSFLNVLS